MAKYFEELGNLCDHQQSSLVNLLQDNGSSLAIFDKEDDTGTYCIKCRSLSDASSMLAFDQASLDSSSRGASLNDIYQRGLQTHLINTSDGDEMPLLNNEVSHLLQSLQSCIFIYYTFIDTFILQETLPSLVFDTKLSLFFF